jgi:LmbE family N-acetylglucosaminyl deacetylase
MRGLLVASTFVVPTSSLTTPASQDRPRTLVALLAHADDEAAAAPVLARYAREGVSVHLIIVTDGSAGSGTQRYLTRSDSGPTGDSLANVRTAEARCAATALGTQAPIFLGFPDGKLGDFAGDRGLIYLLTERLATEIERLRPDVVVTWGPDGGTGHPDHRLVSNIATQLERAGAPGMPDRLFYMYLPVEAFRTANPQRGAPPLLLPESKYFTVRVPFTATDLVASQRSMACHRTQYTPEMLQRVAEAQKRISYSEVAFIPANLATRSNDLFR